MESKFETSIKNENFGLSFANVYRKTWIKYVEEVELISYLEQNN